MIAEAEAQKRMQAALAQEQAEAEQARAQWEARRLAAEEAEKRRKIQAEYDVVYQRFLKEFRSPIGQTRALTLLNGREVIGEVVSVTSNVVTIAKGQTKMSFQRDDLRAGSWLTCYREDYATYRTNKALGLEQQAHILAMIDRQTALDEQQKKSKDEMESMSE
jgi:hypothetical protein